MAAGLAAGLGGLATTALNAPDAFAAVSGEYNVVDDFGAAGDGTTNDRTAIQNAIDAAEGDGGGIVTFPAGIYAVDATTSIQLPDKVRLAGVGPGSIIRADNESTTSSLALFEFDDGARVMFSDLAIEGPAALGTGGGFEATYIDGASGALRVERCSFSRFTYALRVSSSTIWNGAVEAIGCSFTGYGSSQESTPILLNSQSTGGRGRRLTVLNCVFEDFGKTSEGFDHAIYVATDWDFECVNCEFVSAVGDGYAVHLYDENVIAANASRHQKVVGCRFGAGLGGVRGLVSGSQAHVLVDGCTFETPESGIVFNGGGGNVVNCDFVGNATGNSVITTATTAATPVTVKGNRFIGTATRFVEIDDPGDYFVEGNTFDPSSNPSYAISITGAATVRVADNTFMGGANSSHVRVGGSGASNVAVESNRFRETGGTGVENSNANSVLRVVGNDFSATGGSNMTLSATPSTLEVDANHGSGSPSQRRTVIAAEESRNSSSYGTLSTADQATSIVVPSNGLLRIHYRALWKGNTNGATIAAAIFVGANQLKRQAAGAPAVQELAITLNNAGAALDPNVYDLVYTSATGLVSGGANTTAFGSHVTTGQVIEAVEVEVAPGIYTVSVQYKASSGTVTAKERKLFVEVSAF